MDKTDRLKRARELKHESEEQFQAAHESGMNALERHDYPAMGNAISEEASAIEKYRSAINQLRGALKPSGGE